MQLPAGARPVQLSQEGADTLVVRWSHGHTSRHAVRGLRLACRCAQCVDEWTGAPRLAPDSVPPDVKPRSIEPVGLYGLQIDWSDGHNTGIFTYETLAELCECSECRAGARP